MRYVLLCGRSAPHPGCSRPALVEEVPSVPKSGLVVLCSPNPCDQHTHPTILRPPYPFMWYYRTEVRNLCDVLFRVTWFEASHQADGRWLAGNNIIGRSLRACANILMPLSQRLVLFVRFYLFCGLSRPSPATYLVSVAEVSHESMLVGCMIH